MQVLQIISKMHGSLLCGKSTHFACLIFRTLLNTHYFRLALYWWYYMCFIFLFTVCSLSLVIQNDDIQRCTWIWGNKSLRFTTLRLLMQHSTLSSGSPGCLTLICVKASEAGVPPRVGVVGVERQREAATREGDESGIYGGLKLLKVFLPTQKRNKVSIGKDLGKYERRHVLQNAGTVLTSVESF